MANQIIKIIRISLILLTTLASCSCETLEENQIDFTPIYNINIYEF